MTTLHPSTPELTGAVVRLLEDHPTLSTASLHELVEARGQVALGLASLSDEARRRVDDVLAHAARREVRWIEGLLDGPASALVAALDRLERFAVSPGVVAGLAQPEDAATIEAVLRAAFAARDAIELRSRGLQALASAAPDPATEALRTSDARLLQVLDDLLPYTGWRRMTGARHEALWWWTVRLDCDRRALAVLASSGAEPDEDSHAATCEACGQELLGLTATVAAWAALPPESTDQEDTEIHPAEIELVSAVLADLRPDALKGVLQHVDACTLCTARVTAIGARLDAAQEAFKHVASDGREVEREALESRPERLRRARRGSPRAIARRRAMRPRVEGNVHVLSLSMPVASSLRGAADSLHAASASASLDPTSDDDVLPGIDPAVEVRVVEAEDGAEVETRAAASIVVLSVRSREELASDTPLRVLVTGSDGGAVPSIELRRSTSKVVLAVEGTGEVTLRVRAGPAEHVVQLRFERGAIGPG